MQVQLLLYRNREAGSWQLERPCCKNSYDIKPCTKCMLTAYPRYNIPGTRYLVPDTRVPVRDKPLTVLGFEGS